MSKVCSFHGIAMLSPSDTAYPTLKGVVSPNPRSFSKPFKSVCYPARFFYPNNVYLVAEVGLDARAISANAGPGMVIGTAEARRWKIPRVRAYNPPMTWSRSLGIDCDQPAFR